MRYFVLSAHGGIAYLAALRILEQEDPDDVCTFLVSPAESQIWASDPRLSRFRTTKSALIVNGDARNLEDVQRAWHVAEMGIDSECSGIEAVIVSDMSTKNEADELLSVLKCFPCYPYLQPPFRREGSRNSAYTKSPSYLNTNYARTRTMSLHMQMPRSPSYSSRSPRLILVSPSRSPLKRLRTGAEEHLVAWATGKKSSASGASSTTVIASPTDRGSPGTEPGTPILTDAHSIHSSDSGHFKKPAGFTSLFPESSSTTNQLGSGGWLDPRHTLVVRPASLMRRRCRGDKAESSVPYRIQDEWSGGWTISKLDVAHFIVERALGEWGTWGGRRVRIAY
ncbi:hypothetical protein RhiJN_26884 [Ceratobasidium sp. AG-Ba]|nr:hypothetical protein RhiJN_12837 [Ceratobasidium sp. AG-Ba]QRV98865.1 hypothetical protein RhiJN_26884 [Ceratobasidium sp. AG-Ba]